MNNIYFKAKVVKFKNEQVFYKIKSFFILVHAVKSVNQKSDN